MTVLASSVAGVPVPGGRLIELVGGVANDPSGVPMLRRLASRLAWAGCDPVTTREPGHSARAERLRTALTAPAVESLGPMAEAVLIAAARAEHIDRTVRPALARGAWVVCERLVGARDNRAPAFDSALAAALERVAAAGVVADLTLVLERADAPPPRAFVALARNEPERCALIDAAGAPDEIDARIWRMVARRFSFAGSDALATSR